MSQINKNFLSNGLNLLVNIGLGILYTPYLVRTLGIYAYGVIPLALIINSFISIFVSTLTSSLTRFYSIAYQKEDFQDASVKISNTLIILLFLSLLILPSIFIVFRNINSIFNIPAEFISSARVLFLFTILAIVCSFFTSFFNIVLYAINKLNLINYFNVIRQFTKIIVTVILFSFVSVKIYMVGLAMFSAEFIVLILSIFFFNRFKHPSVRIDLSLVEKKSIYQVMIITIFVIIHQLGDLLMYRMDNFLVNRFWSTKISGVLGAFSDLSSYILAVSSIIVTLFGPLVLIAYSKGEHDKIVKYANYCSLFIGLFTAVVAGVIIANSTMFVKFWLGSGIESFYVWLIIKQISLPFFAASGIMVYIYRSWNKVVFPSIVSISLGFFNFLICYFVLNYSKGDLKYINYMLISSCFLSLIQSFGLNCFMVNRLYKNFSIGIIGKLFILIVLSLISSFLISKIISSYILQTSIYSLIVKLICGGVLSSAFTFFILIPTENRKFILSFVKRFKLSF